MDTQAAQRELLQLRASLLDLDESETESLAVPLEEEAGEESYDQHPGDVAAVTLNREMDLSLQENAERMLEQVDRALAKIKDGTYGLCDRCGEPIGEGRLTAVPYATLCMRHQQALEREGMY